MKLVSINVSEPREVEWKGRKVTTGIFKEPVAGRVAVRTLNLDGDAQADLKVHGGPSKALYGYPSEHYGRWRGELDDMELPWGMFGENLTTEGLLEDEVSIGDRFTIGTATLQVTEPRVPCYKLAVRFGRADIVRLFLASGRSGFYFRVLEEGEIETVDEIEPVSRNSIDFTVSDIMRLYTTEKTNTQLLRRAISVSALGEGWRGYFEHQLKKVEV